MGVDFNRLKKHLGFTNSQSAPTNKTTLKWVSILLLMPLFMLVAGLYGLSMQTVVIAGLLSFAVVFAINSAVHSYLMLAYSQADGVSLDVGFYYMLNAGGRLVGTLLSGFIYQYFGFLACIGGSALMILACVLVSLKLL
jgi:predicted MFS family arabinose efflux permease